MTRKVFVFAILLTATTSAFAQEVHRWVITDGPGKRAFIGAALNSLTPELREFFGAPSDAGVLVASLTENGPGAKAGLRVGDVIVGVDGNPINESNDIAQAMKGKKSGDMVKLDVIRNKKPQTLTITAEERDVREFRRTFTLPDMGRELERIDGPEWRALMATPDNEDLRAQIRALEKRLQDLEKKLQQK